MSEAEFRALHERLRRASAWVPADRRGALNNITMSDVVAAAGGVAVGRTVSLAAPIQGPAADNPDPAVHQLAHSADGPDRASGLTFATDRLALNIHGDADSHIDALCHVLFDGTLYNGVPDDTAADNASGRTLHRRRQPGDRRPRPAARHPEGARGALAGAGRSRDRR